MSSDLTQRFIAWAFENRRWPLLIPFSLPVAFRFLQQYHELTFRQTMWNREFQSFCAVVLLVTVILYLWITRGVWKVAVIALCGGLGILLSIILWQFESESAKRKAELEPVKAAQNAVDALMMRQRSSGAFSFGAGDQLIPEDPFITSQVLVAVLLASDDLNELRARPDRLLAALRYLKNCADHAGWGYFCNDHHHVTRVTAWAVLAYVESFRMGLWLGPDASESKATISKGVEGLLASQESSGGFGEFGPGSPRTYATAMAIWALAEAQRTKAIPGQHDDAIRRGVQWLLDHFDPSKGWVPNPADSDDNSYPGLSENVVFTLVRASVSIANLDTVRLLNIEKSTYLRNSEVDKPIETTSATSAYDSFASGELPMTFFWYPWSLAAFANLARDPSLSEADRRFAFSAERVLHDKVVTRFREHSDKMTPTWEIAEDLIGLAVHLRCERKGTCG
jgi:hypothetical protein